MSGEEPAGQAWVQQGRTGLVATMRSLALFPSIPAGGILLAALGAAVAAPIFGVVYILTDSHARLWLPIILLVLAPVLITVLLSTVRGVANLTRNALNGWAGVEIARPYRPRRGNYLRWMLEDPATWRDLGWMVVNLLIGWFLLFIPALGVGAGVVSLIRMAQSQSGLLAAAPFPTQVLATIVVTAAGLWLAPRFLHAYGKLAATLLAPTANAALARRVSHLSQTRAESIDAGAAEIRRIERDLHDGAQARLVAMGMALDAAGALMDDNPEAARALLIEARDNSSRALGELRSLVRGIHPPVLADRGLDHAIRALSLDVPIRTHVTGSLEGRLPAPVESAAYFAMSELLANVAKHASAHQAWIDIRHDDGMLKIGVSDDGRGGADPSGGTGLRGIERRLAAFDGVVAISSPVGGPTVVMMEIPCELSSAKTSSS
jgi:signal transduction histidine kinase